MARIIKFPGAENAPKVEPERGVPAVVVEPNGIGGKILGGLWRGLWTVVVLLWPVLKWVVSIEVFFRLVMMIYHWDTPGSHAGGTFLVHFGVLVALTYFVGVYRPKGVER